jgi:hypothetical protein
MSVFQNKADVGQACARVSLIYINNLHHGGSLLNFVT